MTYYKLRQRGITIAWLLQFLTTVIPFCDNITKIHVINGISLKAATSKLALGR